MIKLALGMVFGSSLCLALHALPSALLLWLLLLALLPLLRARMWFLFACGFGFLWAAWHAQIYTQARLTPALQGTDIVLTGHVVGIPQSYAQQHRFEFEPDAHPQYPLPRLRLSWYRATQEVPQAGERWQLTVRLKRPFGLQNPGGFDYERWLFAQNVGATGYVRPQGKNQLLAAAPSRSITAFRAQLAAAIQTTFPESAQAPLLQGLSVGMRDQMTPEHWRVLRQTGTSHLLAISGLHIGLAAAIGFFLGRWIWSIRSANLLRWPAPCAGAVVAIALASFYALLAGFAIPTQRAMVMVTVLMLGIIWRRAAFNGTTIAFAMLAVLLWDPFAVLSAGFWLSFAAVICIRLLTMHRHPQPRWQWITLHFWLTITLAPLVLLFFAETSVIAPVANFIAIPVVSFVVVPLLLLAMAIRWVSIPLSEALLSAAEWSLSVLWQILSHLADWPMAHVAIPYLPIGGVILALLGVCLLLMPRGLPNRWIGLLPILPILTWQPSKPAPGDFWLSVLDVGQGLSTVVHTHQHTLVFDTGPKHSEQFDTGSAVLIPYLRYHGIREIDLLILSHQHMDHTGGAQALLDAYPDTPVRVGTPSLEPGITPCHFGQSWTWDGVQFDVLHPHPQFVSSLNDMSCVVQISNADHRVLLTGDIEQAAERALVARFGDALRADILQVPHHGSRTSSSAPFIQAVDPAIVIYPLGYRNRYRFPAQEVVARYEKQGAEQLNTAQHGAVLFRFENAQRHPAQTWRQAQPRIWRADATE